MVYDDLVVVWFIFLLIILVVVYWVFGKWFLFIVVVFCNFWEMLWVIFIVKEIVDERFCVL